MWQRVTGALAVCALAGCSLIFPFDGNQDSNSGTQSDWGAREGGADGPLADSDGPLADNDGPNKDVSKPPDGQQPTEGSLKPSCVKLCKHPTWCKDETDPKVSVKLNDVWGSSAGDLWAVGDLGTVLKYNATNCKWEPAIPATMLSKDKRSALALTNLYGVWGEGGAVYVVGARETILRYNGSTWIRDNYTAPSAAVPTPPLLLAVGGGAGAPIVAVGTDGLVWGLVGSSWKKWGSNSSSTLTSVSGKTASTSALGSDAVYVAGNSGALLYNVSTLGTSLKPMMASGCSTSFHWQDVWVSPTVPKPPAPELVAIADTGEVLYYNFTAFSSTCTQDGTLKSLMTGKTVYALDSANANDQWVVGSSGFMARALNGPWAKVAHNKTSDNLRGITVLASPRWVVAVGDSGTIIRTNY